MGFYLWAEPANKYTHRNRNFLGGRRATCGLARDMFKTKVKKVALLMLAAIMLLAAGFAMLFTGQTKTAAAATPSDYWNGNLTQEQYDTLESWGYSFGTQATVTGVNVQFEYSVNTVQQAGRHASATGNFGITYNGSNEANWGAYIAYRSQKSMSGVKKSPLKIGPNPASDGSDTIYNESDSKPFSLMYPVFEREGRTNIYVLNGKYPYIKVYWGDGTEPSSERIYLLKSGPNTTTQWATEDDALLRQKGRPSDRAELHL